MTIPPPHGRVPPHNLNAESSLLGGLFENNAAFDDVAEIVQPADFYREAHRKVFEAFQALATRGEAMDRITVAEELRRLRALEAVGGEEALLSMAAFTPTASNLAYYASMVRDCSLKRVTIEAAHAIVLLGYDSHGPTVDFLDEAQRRILEATEARVSRGGPQSNKAVMRATFKQLERDFERGSSITGVPSGLASLDEMTAGWQPGNLVILAARPAVGKTAAGLGWALHPALRCSVATALFSMEMPKEEIGKRQLANEGRINANRLRTGQLQQTDWDRAAATTSLLADAPIEIDDTSGLSAWEIRARSRRVAKKYANTPTPLGLIVVDYLGLMKLDDSKETKATLVGRNALRLKELARELNIPVIALAQLNRESVKGKPRRPTMSDLRDSGEIEQHADVIVLIHAEDDRYEFIIEKQRNGPVGSIPVTFTPEHTRFSDPDHRYEYPRGGEAP